jgi:A/G-specific adenine glycosylase
LPGPPWRTAEAGGAPHAPPFAARWRRLPGEVEQVFTHFTLRLTLYSAAVNAAPREVEGLFWIGAEEAGRAGFSSAMLKAVAHARGAGKAPPDQ